MGYLHWSLHVSLQKQRINQSKWTKLYIAAAFLQVVIIIVLQSIIASQNQAQEANIHTSFINHRPSTLGDGSSSTSATVDIALRRFDRIKWENVAFISFQAWFICMAFDAVSGCCCSSGDVSCGYVCTYVPAPSFSMRAKKGK